MKTIYNILDYIQKHNQVTTAQLVIYTGISRQAVHKHLKKLIAEKKICKIGEKKDAYYIPFIEEYEKYSLNIIFPNIDLEEGRVLSDLQQKYNFLRELGGNVKSTFQYAFTEMLNNAIEHSFGKTISINIVKDSKTIMFSITDDGIGIFNNIAQNCGLENEREALQELIKGKLSTLPETHSGEGIFFTSKACDYFSIESGSCFFEVDNADNYVSVQTVKETKGTKIRARISLENLQNLTNIFRKYTSSDFEFDTTQITVKLFQDDIENVSRSQARRVVHNLDKFQKVLFDFSGVDIIGQAFVDEIFRVFQNKHPHIKLEYYNCCEDVEFMIMRVVGR